MKKYNKYSKSYHPSAITLLFVILLIVVGSILQGYANGTAHTFIIAISLFILGLAIVNLIFFKGKAELRVFLLTYGVCVFVGGLVQSYSLIVFDNPQSTFDAINFFFPNIISSPPFPSEVELASAMEYALPIMIWQEIYKLTWLLGIDFGPYIGVMFNAFVVAITGSLTVRTAREVYGDDAWRLRRVGTLFAFCGLFILFGSVLLRGSFIIFLNALVLWVIIRWLVRASFLNLLLAIFFTGVAVFFMTYLRWETNILFGLFWLLAFLSWYFKDKLNLKRITIFFLSILPLIIFRDTIVEYFNFFQNIGEIGLTQYNEISKIESSGSSLGEKFIINQPLPIRLALGSVFLILFPIPFWSYFNTISTDYHWIMGYNGIYKILIMPLVFAGFFTVYRFLKEDWRKRVPFIFLAIYILLTIAVVVSTSQEQRHYAQFMNALIILAALPDTRIKQVRTKMLLISGVWFSSVALLYIAWVVIKWL